LVTDVVGYSAMMAEDEAGTLAALQAHRNATDPVILNHGGRIVKSTGDGVLVEFSSATAAVLAAAQVQDVMRERNAELPESRRMLVRLGINLDEIVVDDTGDIFGDGVNIAARVETLSDPGGMAVTNAVYEAVRGKTETEFTDDGEHELKNIPRPVRVWKIRGVPATSAGPRPTLRRTIATIAVLPFDNMSDDSEQEYFADGITEDLITALSYDEYLAVVARNSTFAYKGQSKDIRTIAREIDATHVVEGSVRRSGDRIRVTAQLIDAETGHHIWAERYDRELHDIFEVQDELVEAIAAKLTPSLRDTAGRRRSTGDTGSYDAWDLTIRGQYEANRYTMEGLLAGIEFFDRARELEPDFANAIASSAGAWFFLAFFGWRDETINPWDRGQQDAERAYALASDNYQTLGAMTLARGLAGKPDDAERFARRMIELNPHGYLGFHVLGALLAGIGSLDEAVEASTNAWRLGRHEPLRFDTASDIGYAHYLLGSYEAALAWGKQSIDLVPDYLQSNVLLAAVYAQLGRTADAERHIDVVLASRPGFSCEKHRTRLVYRRTQDRDLIIDGLLKAGLPA
jgi:adenylate cyclase